MAKRPKTRWQIDMRTKLDQMGIGCKELADRAGLNAGSVRQAMCKDGLPGVKKRISEYLGIDSEED